MYDSDSEEEQYTKDTWLNDAYRTIPIAGQKEYRDWFKYLAPDILRNEVGKDTGILCQMYRVVLFIASRMESRVLYPHQKSDDRHTMIRHVKEAQRTNSAVLQLSLEIDKCTDTYDMDRTVIHTPNMPEIDRKILNLYAEGQICIKIAEKYYAGDDEALWKPMFDRLLKVLWTTHLFVSDNYI